MSKEPLLTPAAATADDPLRSTSMPSAASDAGSRRVSQANRRVSVKGTNDEQQGQGNDGNDDAVSMKSEKHVDELHTIKAQTMHRVIEEVHDRDGVLRKVVFLTNGQAKIITESPLPLRLLVETLDMPEPKLLINLIPSFDGSEVIYNGQFWAHAGLPPGLESVRLDVKPPDKHVCTWESKAEYYKAERKLSDFMKDVVIPLAVETNAVILCDASYGQCLLAMVFGRMVGLRRAEWGTRLPFTVIGACPAMPLLYHNKDKEANWRYVRNHCKQWRDRNPRMEQLMEENAGWGFSCDLDPNCSAYLIFDSISESRGGKIGILGPGNLLISALTNHFKERIPCIGIKTGMSWKETSTDRYQTGLSVVVDQLSAGIPVIGLDLRPREMHVEPESTKAELIAKAKAAWIANADKLSFPDILDVCALSFFHPVLGGSIGGADSGKEKQIMPLYVAIEKEEALQVGKKPRKLKLRQSSIGSTKADESAIRTRADSEITAPVDTADTEFEGRSDLDSVIEWIADEFFKRCWNYIPEEDRPENLDYQEHYGDYIQNWLKQAKAIMSNKDFYCVNVENIDEAKQRMRDLVKLDRLPPKNSFEGLRLLRRLWNHHDICDYHAGRYKLTSKISYFLQLFSQIALVICGVLNHSQFGATPGSYRGALPFVISTFASAIITINALVNPMKRWRQLRGSALTLESISWKYRTRVDEFAIQPQTPSAPEIALSDSIRSFLDELVSGTDLDSSDLGRTYHNSVYRHFQVKPESPAFHWGGGDDFQSPCKPADYIQLRILPAKDFYSGRIAPYSWWRYWWMALGLLCTACSSLLSFLGLTMYLGIPSAVANALFAWSEFADINRKMERYNNVVRKLEKLLIWWDGIGEVEKASSANIRKLVLNAESLIAGEYQAWQSVASSGTVSMDGTDISLDVAADSSQVNSST